MALYGPNRPEFVVPQLGCARIGVALVPVNPLYTATDLSYVLARCRAQVCFAVGAFRDRDLREVTSSVAVDLPDLRQVVGLESDGSVTTWEAWLGRGDGVGADELEAARSVVGPDDVISVVFTSGTTGQPKGVAIRTSAMANAGGKWPCELSCPRDAARSTRGPSSTWVGPSQRWRRRSPSRHSDHAAGV